MIAFLGLICLALIFGGVLLHLESTRKQKQTVAKQDEQAYLAEWAVAVNAKVHNRHGILWTAEMWIQTPQGQVELSETGETAQNALHELYRRHRQEGQSVEILTRMAALRELDDRYGESLALEMKRGQTNDVALRRGDRHSFAEIAQIVRNHF